MKVFQNIHDLIGETPLMEITHFPLPNEDRIFAKLEFFGRVMCIIQQLLNCIIQMCEPRDSIGVHGGTKSWV